MIYESSKITIQLLIIRILLSNIEIYDAAPISSTSLHAMVNYKRQQQREEQIFKRAYNRTFRGFEKGYIYFQ